ncbi:hypothetical protein ISCGN_006515 [Ixodes scapularis]
MSDERVPEVPQITEQESTTTQVASPPSASTAPSETQAASTEEQSAESSTAAPETEAPAVALPEIEPSTSIGTEGGVFRVPEVPPVREPATSDPMTPDDDLDDETYVPSEASSSTLTSPGDMDTMPTPEREQFAARDEDVRRRQVAGLPTLLLRSNAPESSPGTPSSGCSSLEGAAGSSGTASAITTPMDDFPPTPGSPSMSSSMPSPTVPPVDPVPVTSEMHDLGTSESAKRRRAAFARAPEAAVVAETKDLGLSADVSSPDTVPVASDTPESKRCSVDPSKLFLDLHKFEPRKDPPPADVEFSPMEEGSDSESEQAASDSVACEEPPEQGSRESEEKDDKTTSDLKED